jgi:hypothetical protein
LLEPGREHTGRVFGLPDCPEELVLRFEVGTLRRAKWADVKLMLFSFVSASASFLFIGEREGVSIIGVSYSGSFNSSF